MKTFENHFTTSAIYTERFKFTRSFVHRLGFTFSLTKAFELKTQLHWPNFVQEHLWCFELQFLLCDNRHSLTQSSWPFLAFISSQAIKLACHKHSTTVSLSFFFSFSKYEDSVDFNHKHPKITKYFLYSITSLSPSPEKIAASNLFLFSFLPFMFSYNPPLHKLIFAMQLKGLWHLSKTHWKLFDKSIRICNAFKVRLDHVKIFFSQGVLIIE